MKIFVRLAMLLARWNHYNLGADRVERNTVRASHRRTKRSYSRSRGESGRSYH